MNCCNSGVLLYKSWFFHQVHYAPSLLSSLLFCLLAWLRFTVLLILLLHLHPLFHLTENMSHPKNADSISGTAQADPKTRIPTRGISKPVWNESHSFHSSLLERNEAYDVESKASKGSKVAEPHQGLAFHRDAFIMVKYHPLNFSFQCSLGKNTKKDKHYSKIIW